MTISADEYNQALLMWLEGKSTLEIAADLHCSEADIWVITKPVRKPTVVKFERKK